MIPKFTLVVAVDEHHLQQLQKTHETWVGRFSISAPPMLVIYDGSQVSHDQIIDTIQWNMIETFDWNYFCDVDYPKGKDRWSTSQRYKMLAGVVYGSALRVKTPYWLKLDTDVVSPFPCQMWIKSDWFVDKPAIVGHRWPYTKPGNTISRLDRWATRYRNVLTELNEKPSLKLKRNPDEDLVAHKRIISWCSFFKTDYTKLCCEFSRKTVGWGKLPVPSQDSYMWYVASRLGLTIRRVNMKNSGWIQCSEDKDIDKVLSLNDS